MIFQSRFSSLRRFSSSVSGSLMVKAIDCPFGDQAILPTDDVSAVICFRSPPSIGNT